MNDIRDLFNKTKFWNKVLQKLAHRYRQLEDNGTMLIRDAGYRGVISAQANQQGLTVGVDVSKELFPGATDQITLKWDVISVERRPRLVYAKGKPTVMPLGNLTIRRGQKDVNRACKSTNTSRNWDQMNEIKLYDVHLKYDGRDCALLSAGTIEYKWWPISWYSYGMRCHENGSMFPHRVELKKVVNKGLRNISLSEYIMDVMIPEAGTSKAYRMYLTVEQVNMATSVGIKLFSTGEFFGPSEAGAKFLYDLDVLQDSRRVMIKDD